METQEKIATKAKIKKIYTDFAAHWGSGEYKNLFRAFNAMEEEDSDNHRRKKYLHKKYPHKLGHYAIFYTPVFYPPACDSPEYMLIGNNPSWFRSNAKTSPAAARDAKEEVSKLEIRPPSENLYLTCKFDFGRQMQNVFSDYPSVLKTIVGLNRFWIQTGGDYRKFRENVSDNNALNEFKKIEKKCECLTRKIVSILKPKAVFLFGTYAKEAFEETSICCYVNAPQPSRNPTEAKRIINEYFENHPPSPKTP